LKNSLGVFDDPAESFTFLGVHHQRC